MQHQDQRESGQEKAARGQAGRGWTREQCEQSKSAEACPRA